MINETSNNFEHETYFSRSSSTLTNTSEIIDDLSNELESNTVPDEDYLSIKKNPTRNGMFLLKLFIQIL